MAAEFKTWMRVCSITGEGMNDGWISGDRSTYFKYETDALKWCNDQGYETILDAYDAEMIEWSNWLDDPHDWATAIEYDGRMYVEKL
jgi:hypothetical protein